VRGTRAARLTTERGTVVDDDQDGLLTRRRLLATGAVAAASYTLLDASASATVRMAEKRPKPVPSFTRAGYRRSRFAPHVGTPVTLRARGGAAVRGTLAGVEDVPNVKSLAGDEDAYTLRFRAPAVAPLAEGIVAIRHNHFGVIELYMTHGLPFGTSQDYLAVVNRRVPRSARRARRR
jgi:hypothetical protein